MFGFHHHHHHGSHGHPGRFAGPRGRFGRDGFGFGWGADDPERHGRRRVFDGGELRLVLLALLEAQPRHGYDLIRAIEERTGGAYAPSPGVVYPALTMLDELGQVDEVKEEGARKRFAIAPAGRAHLDERREAAAALLARLDAIGEHRRRSDRAPVGRALANLHLALRNAMGGDPAREPAIVAILDEAARRIERDA